MLKDNAQKIKEEIAYSVFEKREIVKQKLNIYLCGDEKTDYHGAENLLINEITKDYIKSQIINKIRNNDEMNANRVVSDYREYAEIPCYKSQAEAACEVIKSINNGKRFIDITGPFQAGKTGLFLVVSEIFLKMWEEKNKIARVIIIPMNGKIDIEDQLQDRCKQYSYTSAIPYYNTSVKVFRCNASKKIRDKIEELIKEATEDSPLLIIADEGHWGTEKEGSFAKLVIKNLKKNPNCTVIGVSATQYETDYSNDNIFHKIYMKLSNGYVGPSKISGHNLPHDADYKEKDVIVEEAIPLDLKYYTGREADQNKIKKLLDFLINKNYFNLCNVSKWIDINSAKYASDYLESKNYKVIRHFGKYLKDPLLKKLPKNENYSLVVVDSLQCSTTLPKEIKVGIDLTSFTLEEECPNLTKLQELLGRFCGYGKFGLRLITCPGMKNYIKQYKEGSISIRPHSRVVKNDANYRILYFPESFKANKEWIKKQTSEIFYVPDEYFTELNELAKKYKKGTYKDKKGDPETKNILNKIINQPVENFYYRTINELDLIKTWSGSQIRVGILIDDKKKVWGVYRYQELFCNKDNNFTTGKDSIYVKKDNFDDINNI